MIQPDLKKTVVSFDKMITPKLIELFYGISMVLLAIAMVFVSIQFLGDLLGPYGPGMATLAYLVSIPIILLVGLLIRVFWEAMIVFFKINENLQRMADATDEEKGQAPKSKAAA